MSADRFQRTRNLLLRELRSYAELLAKRLRAAFEKRNNIFRATSEELLRERGFRLTVSELLKAVTSLNEDLLYVPGLNSLLRNSELAEPFSGYLRAVRSSACLPS